MLFIFSSFDSTCNVASNVILAWRRYVTLASCITPPTETKWDDVAETQSKRFPQSQIILVANYSFRCISTLYVLIHKQRSYKLLSGWLGRAMVLSSFQCRGVLLLWHMVGQGLLCLQQVRYGWAVFFFFFFFFFLLFLFCYFISSIQSSFSNASSLGRRLEILKYCGLGHYPPTVVVSYYRMRAR